jgi:hypothetical protein
MLSYCHCNVSCGAFSWNFIASYAVAYALQAMLEDKLRATDWEATNEAIEEQVARESYLQWLRDNEQRNKNMVCA